MSESTAVPSGTARTLRLLGIDDNGLGYFCDDNDRTDQGIPKSLYINNPSKTLWDNGNFVEELKAASGMTPQHFMTNPEITRIRQESLTHLKLQEHSSQLTLNWLVTKVQTHVVESPVSGHDYSHISDDTGGSYLAATWGPQSICFRHNPGGASTRKAVFHGLQSVFPTGTSRDPAGSLENSGGHFYLGIEFLKHHLENDQLQVYLPTD